MEQMPVISIHDSDETLLKALEQMMQPGYPHVSDDGDRIIAVKEFRNDLRSLTEVPEFNDLRERLQALGYPPRFKLATVFCDSEFDWEAFERMLEARRNMVAKIGLDS